MDGVWQVEGKRLQQQGLITPGGCRASHSDDVEATERDPVTAKTHAGNDNARTLIGWTGEAVSSGDNRRFVPTQRNNLVSGRGARLT